MQCLTEWEFVLEPTPGTADGAMLRRLRSTKNTFALYARLRTQLAQRPLDRIQLHPACPERPFLWPPVCSDDFYFEDAMRMAARALELQALAGVKPLQMALAIVQALLNDVYVHKWQTIPVLPPGLKHESLQKSLRSLRVAYIEAMFHQFTLQRHPIETHPEKSTAIVNWLAQEKRETYASYALWVTMESLFQRALRTADDDAMRCALCHATKIEKDSHSPRRARERAAYMRHFAGINFIGLDTAPHTCIEPEQPAEFRAQLLFDKIVLFSWEKEAEEEPHIFTL